MQFSKLYAPSLKDLFVAQLQEKILSGELAVGTRLPSEREIAEQMQVSRAVVNNGMAQLSRQGFLEVRPRQGTYVADYRRNGNMDTLLAIMHYNGGHFRKEEIRSILEFRMGLEHITVRRAIEFASDAEIATLRRCLEDLRDAKRYTDAAEAAFQFHHEMAIIGGNQILPLVYSSFRVPVCTLWERFCQKYGVESLYTNTERLYQHIAKRDLVGADAWIEEYLNNAITGEQTIYEL